MTEPALTDLIEDLDPTQKPGKPRMTTPALLDRLRAHHTPPPTKNPQIDLTGGDLVVEVGINGDHSQNRVDAVHVGYTTNSGRILTGYELKVSRGDWTRELNKPGKADRWADACHSWVIVAPDITIVPPETLPDGWGLMVLNPRAARRMTVVVKPAVKRHHNPPWWAVRSIMARQNTLAAKDVADQVRAKLQAVQAEEERRRGQLTAARSESTDHEAQEAKRIVADFRDAGISLGRSVGGAGRVTPALLRRCPELLDAALADAQLRVARLRLLQGWGGIDQLRQLITEMESTARDLGGPA